MGASQISRETLAIMDAIAVQARRYAAMMDRGEVPMRDGPGALRAFADHLQGKDAPAQPTQ
jgi:hypothetical protein